MGSSSKKKKEKKKDFVKPKLKVGKTKAKPANYTSTSFKSKGIVVGQQSLHQAAPTDSAKLAHNISLLNHHSPTTRRDALSYITSTINVTSSFNSSIVPTLAPLILDSSHIVRRQLLVLLNTLRDVADIQNVENNVRSTTNGDGNSAGRSSGSAAIRMYASRYLLYIQSAMTHIAADVRADSTNFLSWLLTMVGVDAVRGVRGWTKTLNCWMVLMGFDIGKGGGKKMLNAHGLQISAVTKSMAAVEFADAGKVKKTTLQHLGVLKEFLETGIQEEGAMNRSKLGRREDWREVYLVPKSSNVFSRLGLFANEEEGGEDVASRIKIWEDGFKFGMVIGLKSKQDEGGEVGRIAGHVLKALPSSINT